MGNTLVEVFYVGSDDIFGEIIVKLRFDLAYYCISAGLLNFV